MKKRRILRKYFKILKNIFLLKPKYIILIYLISIFTALINPIGLVLNSMLIDEAITSITSTNTKTLYVLLFIILCVNLVRFSSVFFGNIIKKKIQQELDVQMTTKLMESIKSVEVLKLQSLEHQNKIALAKEITNGFSIMSILQSMIGIVGIIVSLISYIAIIGSKYGLIFLVISLFLQSILIIINIKKTNKTMEIHEKETTERRKSDYYYNLLMNVESSKEALIYGLKNHIIGMWESSYSEVRKKEYDSLKLNRYNHLIFSILSTIVTFIAIFIMLKFKIYTFTIGNILLLMGALDGIQSSSFNINIFITNWQFSYEKYHNFEKYITEFKDKSQKENRIESSNDKDGIINCENLTFLYPNSTKKILTNVSLKIFKGEKIAIVGQNGAGKSTLINLLLGIYTPTEGKIRVNSNNPNQMLNEISCPFSYVGQSYSEFEGLTLKENVLLSDKEGYNLDFLLDKNILDKNFDEILGKQFNGIKLSGGESQRLAILRGITKDEQIYILDEPTSSIDPLTELYIYEKIFSKLSNKTLIFVTHRLASTKHCNRIIVLDNGEIIEEGTHDELMSQKNKYHEMFTSQSKWYQENVSNEN